MTIPHLDRPNGVPPSPRPTSRPPDRSGRRFVILALLAIAGTWGTIFLFLREWRGRYLEQQAFGLEQLAPLVDAIGEQAPPDVSPDDWQSAVVRTRVMLLSLSKAGLLSIPQLEELRDALRPMVDRARARPDAAAAELAAVWDAAASRESSLFTPGAGGQPPRFVRPPILRPAPAG